MKTIRIALVVALIAGCASAPRKISGKYGVVIDPKVSFDDDIVRALRDRLSSVDVVASPADDAYDAVIVLSWEAGGRWTLQPDDRRFNNMHVQQRMDLVHYQIMRGGKKAAEGSIHVAAGYPPRDISSTRHQTVIGDDQPLTIQRDYGRGIDVARVVVKALKDAG